MSQAPTVPFAAVASAQELELLAEVSVGGGNASEIARRILRRLPAEPGRRSYAVCHHAGLARTPDEPTHLDPFAGARPYSPARDRSAHAHTPQRASASRQACLLTRVRLPPHTLAPRPASCGSTRTASRFLTPTPTLTLSLTLTLTLTSTRTASPSTS